MLDFEFGAKIYGEDGAYLAFCDNNGQPVVQILLENGDYKVLNTKGAYTDTHVMYTSETVHFDIHINLDKKIFDLGIDGVYAGTYPFARKRGISSFRYGVTKTGVMQITADYAVLTHNYLELERFNNAPNGVVPYNVITATDGGSVTKVNLNTNNANGGSVALNSDADGMAKIYGEFEKASGNVVFETYILLPTELNGAKIALKNGAAEVFSLSTKDGSFVSPDGETVKYVTKNLWHIVRFEADTATGKALVKINGKDVGVYDFTNPSSVIDGYEIIYTPSTASAMYVDDITAFIKLPYPEDYVPEPVIPNGDDYLVGMNVCSLWREGTHYGWEEITAYPELTPVLGYYDEGTPEVSDWEIKMMAEHGIDYQIYCWYPGGNITQPIQSTPLNQALIDGYFNARYSDKMKFAIMWENTAVNNMSFQDFKDYTVPYWIEYFFKDDRYLKINNKPLLTIWHTSDKFSDCTFKQAMDYVREQCVAAGFAGCEILCYSRDASKQTISNEGIDGILAYHWGTTGANEVYQANVLEAYSALDYTVPTISVGFDNVGWGNSQTRNGMLDPSDYPTMTNIVKTALASRSDKYSNMVNISTWNEYGEGTYVMPTERHGFEYLDAIRAAFTTGGTHSDVTELTPSQRQRINYLFGQDRQLLRPQLLKPSETYSDAYVAQKITFENASVSEFTCISAKMTIEDGIVKLVPTSNDNYFNFKDTLSVPANEANAVRIKAKVTGYTSDYFHLYYRTDVNNAFSEAMHVKQPHVINEWNYYIFDMRDEENWTSNITDVRIDPGKYLYELAEVESVEFIKLPDKEEPFTVDINGVDVSLVEPVNSANGVMMHIYPETGVLSRLKSTYTWDKNNSTLTITNAAHTVSFVIGESTATVDGSIVTLDKATYMDDGLPVIPFVTLCEELGYFPVFHADGKGVSIMLNGAEDYDEIINRVPGQYEFNVENDCENWTTQQCSIYVSGGMLNATASGNDPALYSPKLSLDASSYSTLKILVKLNGQSSDNCVVYFTTDTQETMTEATRVNVLSTVQNNDFVELTFDMSGNENWTGKITGIRFDPFNAKGSFEIDYIRLQ